MNEMIERVAVAMVQHEMRVAGIDENSEVFRAVAVIGRDMAVNSYGGFARAAIEAMREPTEGMIYAGDCADPGYEDGNATAEYHWPAMIDEALK